jgi:hypothetical protein
MNPSYRPMLATLVDARRGRDRQTGGKSLLLGQADARVAQVQGSA